MQVAEVLETIIRASGVSNARIARALGKSPSYMNPIRYGHAMPLTDTMASICDVIGYDLIVRNRNDGTEYVIDPPNR